MQNCRVHSLILGADETVQTTFINKRLGKIRWELHLALPGAYATWMRGTLHQRCYGKHSSE